MYRIVANCSFAHESVNLVFIPQVAFVTTVHTLFEFLHDVWRPKYLREMRLAIIIYEWTTAPDHTGWSVAVSSGVFAEWVILYGFVTSKRIMFVLGITP